MGSLVKLFEGQTKVWTMGRSLAGFLSHNQSSAVPKSQEKIEEVCMAQYSFVVMDLKLVGNC